MLRINRPITRNRKVYTFIALGLLAIALFTTPSAADNLVAKATQNLPPNAYCYYLKSLKVRRQAALTNPSTPPEPPDPGSSLPQNAEPYKQNATEIKADVAALEIVRQGFAFKYIPVESESDNSCPIPVDFGMRTIVRLFAKESATKAANEDWAGAANSALDGMRLGQDISHGSISDMLIGRSIQAIASQSLRNIFDHVDAKTAKTIVARLADIYSQKIDYADVLQAEKHQGLWFFKELATSADWRKEAHVSSAKSLAELKNEYVVAMDELVANARLPYPWRETSIPAAKEPFNQTTLGLFSDPKYVKSGLTQGIPLAIRQTQSTFILVEFALRAYRLDHHHYPQTLSELAPNYLREVPEDPFSAHQPLHYKITGKGYMLYSIGPDGRDNGGKQVLEKRIDADSRGDIVADLEKNSA